MSARRILVGLIGANITKSLSPALHADAFAAAGMDGYYHLMDVDILRGRSLAQLLAAAKATGFAGTNVTFPFKQEVLALLDDLDHEAEQIGAVNTVTIAPDGRTKGYNTDRSGFRRNFESGLGRPSAEGASAVLVGAGGAGRAVGFALMDLGIADLAVHDRNGAQMTSLVADLRKHFGEARCRPVDDLARAVAAADGVVNATPVGMAPGDGLPAALGGFVPAMVVADIVPRPTVTPLLAVARAAGCHTVAGTAVIEAQADTFLEFFGCLPPAAAGKRAS